MDQDLSFDIKLRVKRSLNYMISTISKEVLEFFAKKGVRVFGKGAGSGYWGNKNSSGIFR